MRRIIAAVRTSPVFLVVKRYLSKIVVLWAFSCLGATPSFATLLLSSDFETGEYASYWNISGVAPTVETTPVCAGNYAAKFFLDFNNSNPNYRTELTWKGSTLATPGEFEIGGEYWLGFAIFLSDTWQPDDIARDKLIQYHSRPDFHLGEEYNRGPPLDLRILGDNWRIRRRWDPNQATQYDANDNAVTVSTETVTLGPWKKGQWTEFVLHIKLDYTDAGFIEVWMDGVNVTTITGGNVFNDERGPYLKTGNYKSAWRHGPSDVATRLHYLDELRIGDAASNYAEVAPPCGSSTIPPPLVPLGLTLDIN